VQLEVVIKRRAASGGFFCINEGIDSVEEGKDGVEEASDGREG